MIYASTTALLSGDPNLHLGSVAYKFPFPESEYILWNPFPYTYTSIFEFSGPALGDIYSIPYGT